MTAITLDAVDKRIGNKTLLDNVSFTVASGEFLVLLGESGSGKSTTLRLLAGLDDLSAGTIHFDQREVSGKSTLPANRRDLGFVFQNFALWPHLSVLENVAYPLRARGKGAEEAHASALEALALVRLSDYGERRPHELSGGQQQRVGLARAIVARPKVILFDEPLSSLDATLRRDLREEISTLHQRLGFTAVYVTHDRQEAFALADKVAVLHGGVLEQFGPVENLISRPASQAVAKLLGFDAFQEGHVEERLDAGRIRVRVGSGDATGFTLIVSDPDRNPAASVKLAWRSADIVGHPFAGSPTAPLVSATIVSIRNDDLTNRRALVDAGGVRFDAHLPAHLWHGKGAETGDPIHADFSVLPPVILP